MKKLLAVLLSLMGAGLIAGDVVVAENGQAKADIVIPSEPSAYVKFAAEELKQYLDKMTGGSFKITSQPTAEVKIRLGQSPEAEAAGLRPETLRQDGFFISAKGGEIFIVGVDSKTAKGGDLFHLFLDEPRRATLLGAYTFLEQLGVRWPAPGPAHEFVPKKETIKIPEGTQKIEPFFQDRQLEGFWNFWRKFPDAKEYASDREIFLWGLRLRLSGRGMVTGCHSEQVLKLKEIWGETSGRFALIKGERNPLYSCWTDPAVAEVWEKAADAYFSGRKPADAGLPHLKPYLQSSWPWPFISGYDFLIDPMDHSTACDGRCRCPRCEEFREKHPCEDDSEIIWKVIAGVAESMKKKHPGKFISTLVYPPKMKLPKHVKIPDNVRVRICIHGPGALPTPNRMKAELELVRAWSDALGGNKPPLWTYQCEASFGRRLPGVPETYPRLVAEFLRIFRNDIAGMFFEQEALTHTFRNLDMYVAARLLWDPSRDVEAEMADYFKSYYGPAAEPARKLFRRFEDNWVKYWKLATPDKPKSEETGLGAPAKDRQKLVWSKIYDTKEMAAVDGIIAEVEKAAAGDPVHARRAGLLRPWLFDIMKAERAEVMEKAETRQKIVASIPSLKTAPSEADWKSAAALQLVSASRLKPQLAAGGQFKLLRFGGTLFLRAELKEPLLSDSQTKKDRKPGDSGVWQDNDAEIFIYSEKSRDLWQIIVNDQGNWASQVINTGKAKWTPMEKLQVKVSQSADGWTIEAAIPLEKLGSEGLRFNIARSRQVKGQPNELSTWSPLAKVGNWHDPDNYGSLVFAER